jgi:hypothetical protein
LVALVELVDLAGIRGALVAVPVLAVRRWRAQHRRSAGEDRALAIMAYLVHDIVHTASVRAGMSWEDAWEAAARQARLSMAHIVRERGEYDEKRPGDRF